MATKPIRAAIALALAGCTALAGPGVALAQVRAPDLHAGTLSIPLNKSQVVSADRPIAKALVGNDEVADVLPITDRSLYVLGKKMGTTSLTLYDASGRVIAVMDVAVGPDVEALTTHLRQMVPGQPIEATISNESIVLTGLVDDAGSIDRAMQIARTFAGDKVVNLISLGASQQVMLEVRFAEVSRNSGFDVGLSAFGQSNNGTFDGVTGQGAQLIPGPNGSGQMNLLSLTDTFGIFRKQFSIGNLNIEGILNALETRGLAKTLAQPTLIALSGEKASFLAGGEFPVPVAQSGTGAGNGAQAITVEFKPFGVSLAFTPTVLGDKTINLLVEPEVSSIDPNASLTVGNITIPGLRTRRASTTLELRDGESFAIAGLLQKDFRTTVSQLPLLGSIPIIGALFRSSNFQKGETELLIVVTPHLVAPIRPSQVRLPTDAIRDPSAAETIFMGRSGTARPLAPPSRDGLSAAPSAAAPVQVGKPELPPASPTAAAEPAKEATYAY